MWGQTVHGFPVIVLAIITVEESSIIGLSGENIGDEYEKICLIT